jgi:DNA helicase-2/ATP-dependent DNA helicase PcrA
MNEVFVYGAGQHWMVTTGPDQSDHRRFGTRSEAFAAARQVARTVVPSRIVSAPPGSVADVSPGDDPDPGPDWDPGLFGPTTISAAPPTDAPGCPRQADGTPDWDRLAGPSALGRSLLIPADAEIPLPWHGCPQLTVSVSSLADASLQAQVREAFLGRVRMIYRGERALEPPLDERVEGDVWSRAVDFEIASEVTWAMLTANTVDARDPGEPHWAWAERAVAAGAHRGVTADVVLPDGTDAYCDGGPLQFSTVVTGAETGDRAVVVHRIALERAELTPLGSAGPVADLAADQLEAVADTGARSRIIAPAGSGKTRVLTERARHLLRERRVPASAVCMVAFNKRAQTEMTERTADQPNLPIWTLNALGLAILNGRRPFLARNRNVYTIDEHEVRRIIGGLVSFPRRANTDPAAAWLDALSAVRLQLRSPSEVEARFGGEVDGFASFFPRYRRALHDTGVVDFDEQIYGAVEALLAEPATRHRAQWASRVVLVDEFQDLTPAHLLLLRLLASPGLDVFGVGDDDQTIYGYSGAAPDWLIDFNRYFPGATHHALEVNYRCPEPVITAADHLLSHNRRRVPKTIRANPARRPSTDAADAAGAGLEVVHAPEPTTATLEHIAALVEAGTAPTDIVVLTRVNALLASIQVGLHLAGIPASHAEGVRFLERTGVVAALSWLALATSPANLDGADIQRAARRPGRSLSPRVIEWMAEQGNVAALQRLAERLNGRDAEKVLGFVVDLDRARRLARTASTERIVEFIRSELGLDRAMETLDAAHRGRNDAAHSDDLRALIALGRLHPDGPTFASWLRTSLGHGDGQPGVALSTVHRVKGLEWPHVIVHDATDGIFPHRLSTDPEEERRVFHVALTRGRQSVHVVADAADPSPFLTELATAAPPLTASDLSAVFTPTDRLAGRGDDRALGSTSDRSPTSAKAGRSRRSERRDGPHENERVLEALRAWRRERARSDAVPAYVVANDRTLDEIATLLPAKLDDLLQVNGIGPTKLERYGDEILAVIDDLSAR